MLEVACFGGCGARAFAETRERRGKVYVAPPRGWYMAEDGAGVGGAFMCEECAHMGDGEELEPPPIKVCGADVCPCAQGFAVHGVSCDDAR